MCEVKMRALTQRVCAEVQEMEQSLIYEITLLSQYQMHNITFVHECLQIRSNSKNI